MVSKFNGVFLWICFTLCATCALAQDEALLELEGPIGIQFVDGRTGTLSTTPVIGDAGNIRLIPQSLVLDRNGRVVDGIARIVVRDNSGSIFLSTSITNVRGFARYNVRSVQNREDIRSRANVTVVETFFVLTGRQTTPVPAAFRIIGRGVSDGASTFDPDDVLQAIEDTDFVVEGYTIISDSADSSYAGIFEQTVSGFETERGFFTVEEQSPVVRRGSFTWSPNSLFFTETDDGLASDTARVQLRVQRPRSEGDVRGFRAAASSRGARAEVRGTHTFTTGTLEAFNDVAEIRETVFRSPIGMVRTRYSLTDGDRDRMASLNGSWEFDYDVTVDINGTTTFRETSAEPLPVILNYTTNNNNNTPDDNPNVGNIKIDPEDTAIGSYIVRLNRLQVRVNLDLGEHAGLDFSDVRAVFEATYNPDTDTIVGTLDEIRNLPGPERESGSIFGSLIDYDVEGSFVLRRSIDE